MTPRGPATHRSSNTIARIAVAACAAVLLGCGASDEERVAEAVAAYPRALAARDAEAACDALSRDARAQVGADETCDTLQRVGERLTPEQRQRYERASGVDVEVSGDSASARLRIGDCTLRAPLELVRDGDGDWRIAQFAAGPYSRGSRCL